MSPSHERVYSHVQLAGWERNSTISSILWCQWTHRRQLVLSAIKGGMSVPQHRCHGLAMKTVEQTSHVTVVRTVRSGLLYGAGGRGPLM